jgi:hypothetical protein
MQQRRRFNRTAPLDQSLIEEAQRSGKRPKVPIQESNASDLSDEPGKLKPQPTCRNGLRPPDCNLPPNRLIKAASIGGLFHFKPRVIDSAPGPNADLSGRD